MLSPSGGVQTLGAGDGGVIGLLGAAGEGSTVAMCFLLPQDTSRASAARADAEYNRALLYIADIVDKAHFATENSDTAMRLRAISPATDRL